MSNDKVQSIMALATKMMRDSWATGNDASWQPAYQALESAIREAIAAPGVATDENTIALAMLAVDDPLQWGRLGPDSKKMIVQFVRALAAPSPTAEQRPPYCGSGHCSCIECPYGSIKGGNE